MLLTVCLCLFRLDFLNNCESAALVSMDSKPVRNIIAKKSCLIEITVLPVKFSIFTRSFITPKKLVHPSADYTIP
jgi:hypothetical protein